MLEVDVEVNYCAWVPVHEDARTNTSTCYIAKRYVSGIWQHLMASRIKAAVWTWECQIFLLIPNQSQYHSVLPPDTPKIQIYEYSVINENPASLGRCWPVWGNMARQSQFSNEFHQLKGNFTFGDAIDQALKCVDVLKLYVLQVWVSLVKVGCPLMLECHSFHPCLPGEYSLISSRLVDATDILLSYLLPNWSSGISIKPKVTAVVE